MFAVVIRKEIKLFNKILIEEEKISGMWIVVYV